MPISRTRNPVGPLAIVLLATLWASACSARSDAPVEHVTDPTLRQALLLSSAPGPPDRSCHIVREELPPTDQLVDSVAVMDAIRGFDPSSVLLSLKFDTLGVTEFVRIIESDGGQADRRAERLADVVERELRHQAGADAWRLKLVSGPDPAIQVGYSEFCRPHLTNPEVASRVLSEARVGQPEFVVARFRIGEGGRVHETRIVQHPGEFAARLAIRDLGEHLRFRPALLDGFPVPVWVSIPIHTVTPGGPAWSRGHD